MVHILRSISALVDLILPRPCAVCSGRLDHCEKFICDDCRRDMPLTYFWDMDQNIMADRLNEKIQQHIEATCQPTSSSPCHPVTPSPIYEPYAHCAALFYYSQTNNYRFIPQRLKYDADLPLGRYFATELGERLASSANFCDVDLVVPVPLHLSRRLKRGYNQSDILASGLALTLGAAHSPSLLLRSRRTHSQTMISLEEKSANVSGAFTINKKLLTQDGGVIIKKSAEIIHPTHILLVDDTFTTGSTCAECHRALRAAFPMPTRISVATLACVGR